MSSEREDRHCEVAATHLLANDNSHSVCAMLGSAEATRRNVPTLTRSEADGPQKSTQQSRRSRDDERFRCNPAFREEGATGKAIAKKIGRSVVALYQKVSIEDISLSARPTVRRLAVAKKAKAVAASTRRPSR